MLYPIFDRIRAIIYLFHIVIFNLQININTGLDLSWPVGLCIKKHIDIAVCAEPN